MSDNLHRIQQWEDRRQMAAFHISESESVTLIAMLSHVIHSIKQSTKTTDASKYTQGSKKQWDKC